MNSYSVVIVSNNQIETNQARIMDSVCFVEYACEATDGSQPYHKHIEITGFTLLRSMQYILHIELQRDITLQAGC